MPLKPAVSPKGTLMQFLELTYETDTLEKKLSVCKTATSTVLRIKNVMHSINCSSVKLKLFLPTYSFLLRGLV